MLTAQGQQVVYDPKIAATFDYLNGKILQLPEMEDETGNIFKNEQLKGKTLYVDFWFTTCPPCLEEIEPARALKTFFQADTNIVFLNICIENFEKKEAWKTMIKEKQIKGINLFYARNRPQRLNLVRLYGVDDFPTYLLVNPRAQVIGYRAPRPSQSGWVHWALYNAGSGQSLSSSYRQMFGNDKNRQQFFAQNRQRIDSLNVITGMSPSTENIRE
ncbi:TlpA family protein disulfide reductase [Segetibacter sp. 3557_3]|uniref:TlpA family protein disulfide reductase n=1 Tax=Segetibacter sp. 3557_3 TaxID=2547429 RepID=UPI001404C8B4|nr:TlpA disulfide reductase family protein [Segetibacter sp. 3557_3]